MNTKRLFLLLVAVVFTFALHAQLKVTSDGKVTIGSTTVGSMPSKLTVGPDQSTGALSTKDIGIYSVGVSETFLSNSYGVVGRAWASDNSLINNCMTTGVMGVAGNMFTGYNYGVSGGLDNHAMGAAIYGSLNTTGLNLQGRYAGYFKGATYVDGTLTATKVVSPSDKRLKTNIEPLGKETLQKVQEMNVVSYNYVDTRKSQEAIDLLTGETITIEEDPSCSQRHYGLIAQELQELYPDLVHEGQDGYLGINYIELVPVLIRAIQELKQQVDELQGTEVAKGASAKSSTTDVRNTTAKKNILYQNTPNPAKEQTIIRYRLADNAKDAAICIFDMQGKMLKKLPVSSDNDSVTINGYELGQGMFLYSLIINGQEIDTKKMIITK